MYIGICPICVLEPTGGRPEADPKHANANELLAELYADDRGMPQGNSSAMKLLKEGMRVGSEKAATNLGTLYGQQR